LLVEEVEESLPGPDVVVRDGLEVLEASGRDGDIFAERMDDRRAAECLLEFGVADSGESVGHLV
jgi:hypothetical protein